MSTSFALGTILNFAWVESGVLARGEQPSLEPATFAALYDVGITAVLSLRPDGEAPSPAARRPWPEYHVSEERAVVEAAGMRFRHLPLADFSAPSPDQIAAALSILDELLDERPGVYVHCRAGAGRSGVVAGAWSVAHGHSGDDAAADLLSGFIYVFELHAYTPPDMPAFARRVGQPYVYWALCQIASALGSPVTRELATLLPPARPQDADHWEQGYTEVLRPWRRTP